MKAIIINFRGGFRRCRGDEVVLRPLEEVKGQIIGRKVVWLDPRTGNRVIGKIVAAHGGSCYRVLPLGLAGLGLGK